MSERCHICGPVKHEAPTVLCMPCTLNDSSGCADGAGNASSSAAGGPRKADSAPPAGELNPRAFNPNACPSCGSLMLTTSAGERCVEGCA